MNLWSYLKKVLLFQKKHPQFSLGDKEWNRPPLKKNDSKDQMDTNLSKNRAWLEETFFLPKNIDVVVRDFKIPSINEDALIIYIDGLTDRNTQNFAILQPLMLLGPDDAGSSKDPIEIAYQKLVPSNQIQKSELQLDVINGILDGSSVLLIDGSSKALIIETKGWEHRTVERPANENVVIGPQEGFTETFRSNTASVRLFLKDPKLITEVIRVGKRSNTILGIMYIHDIANPKLVEEVRYRIQSVSQTTDYISETGTLEEFIEDHPKSIVPQMLSTERPDRLAAYIREGHVGIIMQNSPNSLVIPTTFTIFIHSAEDYYLRWPFGNFLRLIRGVSIFIALLLPAIYIGVVNFHQEMIPTDLLLAITTARENVPFPSVVELLFMQFSFELIREAGVRIPNVIGPTIGIVGALILGQAAVAASIVSPILIVIIAITALASFVVPNYSASFTIRILQFVFIILGGFLGFFGIAFGIFVMALHMASLTSFGVPFLTPIAPYRPKNKDRIIRPREFDQTYRPTFMRPLDWIRQKKVARPWDRPDFNDQGDESDGK